MAAAVKVVVIADTRRVYRREIVRGVAEYARRAGNWILSFDPFGEQAPPRYISVGGCHGVIVSASRPGIVEDVAAMGVPAVNVSGALEQRGMPSVVPDSFMIGRMAARHLLDRGLRNLGFVADPGRLSSDERAMGIDKEVKARGVTCSFHVVHPQFRVHEKWLDLQKRLERWLQELPKPVGVIAANDIHCRRLAIACQRLGYRIPEDVALVGIDNEELTCEFSDPPMSSVDPSWWRVGFEAASVLDGMMAGRPGPTKTVLIRPAGVVLRASSDVLAVSDPLVAKAVTFIRDHAREGITVRDVVKHLSVSRRLLELRFSRCLGKSPNAEILRVRVDRAKGMLVQTSLPLGSLAKACGFSDRRSMGNAFSKETGLTPSQYRRKYRRT